MLHPRLTVSIKILSNELNRKVSLLFGRGQGHESAVQMMFVNYIAFNTEQGRIVFQKELEQEFNVRRSSASGVLQTLEKRGLITRTSMATDGRKKSIKLTPAGQKLYDENFQRTLWLERQLLQGISEKDQQTFYQVVETIYHNSKKIDQLEDSST